MAAKRRLEFKQGNSNKFYELTISETNSGTWNLNTKWGRIGTFGTEQNRAYTGPATVYFKANEKIKEKLKKGYEEVTSGKWESVPSEKKEVKENFSLPNVLNEKDIKLPKVWSKVREDLIPGELAVYEKYNDGRTKQRRNSLASKWKSLIEPNLKNKKIRDLHRVAWLFLRYTYLNYLSQVSSYKPAAMEAVRATVGQLKNNLNEVPDDQKEQIDSELKKFTCKLGPLTLKECEEGVNSLVDKLSKEIKEQERTGLGGVSRKRAKMLARKLNNNK